MEAHVKFSKEYIKKLNDAHANRFIWMYISVAALFFGIGLYYTISAINKEGQSIYPGLGICAVGLIYYPMLRLISAVRINKSIKDGGMLDKNLEYSFKFNPNSVMIYLEGDGIKQTKEYRYDELFKIVIRKKYVILYVDQTQGFYIPQKSVFKTSFEDLCKFLKEKKNK